MGREVSTDHPKLATLKDGPPGGFITLGSVDGIVWAMAGSTHC